MRGLLLSLVALAGCRQLAGLDDLDTRTDAPPENRGELAPSNEVPADHATINEPAIVVNDVVTIDTDTGQMSGAIVRAPGEGIVAGIKYSHADFAGTALGVFAMSELSVNPSGLVKLQGTRSAVFVVEKTAKVDGRIDGGGGCADVTQRRCGGPGGGAGATAPSVGTGCAPGQPGNTQLSSGADTGGGGGGGGQPGAAGGNETAMSVLYQGGAGGPRCMTIELEPLLGGAGGGGGGKGTAPQGAAGGGGGGAFQLSAFGSITVSGVITMPGAGGEGGTTDPATANGGAGGGGGAGGSILLESPSVSIAGTLAANGGGGGGGSIMMIAGQPGANGTANAIAAMGGAPGGAAGMGGSGGIAGTEPAAAPATVSANSGGGGGGVGRIFLRSSTTPDLSGAVLSPAPGVAEIRTR